MKTHFSGPLPQPLLPLRVRDHARARRRGRSSPLSATVSSGPPVDPVAVDLGVVGVVEQQPVVAVAIGDVVADHQPVRVHDGVADMVADRDVAADFAVVGVHVVDREAHLLEAVADEAVLAAGNGEDAVAAVAEGRCPRW